MFNLQVAKKLLMIDRSYEIAKQDRKLKLK